MTRSALTRGVLSFAVLALAVRPLRAQVVGAAVSAPGVSGGASAASASRAGGTPAVSLSIPSLAPALSAAPLSAPAFAGAPSAAAIASPAAAASLPRAARAAALAPVAAAADGPTPLQQPLKPGEYWSPHADGRRDPRMGTGDEWVHSGPRGRELVPISAFEAPETPDDWNTSRTRSGRAFDGSTSRRALAEPGSVAGSVGSAAAPLAKPSAASTPARAAAVPALPAARRFSYASLGLKIALGVALFLLTPGIALAAGPAADPITVASTLAIMTAMRPIAAALGAVAGAVYGMFAARPKDGSEASAGETFASVLRYGALGGASVFMLLDVTSLAFVGPSAAGGLQPLSSAVVTAALGRTAFQGKFMDAATTSADRIVGAFPAVAAALGISLGVVGFGLVAPPLTLTAAMAAMTVTGVAVAVYTAIFKLGRSPLTGPSQMAKGFVLQSLMMGLSLAVTNVALAWIFAALGAAGFGLVLWASAQELLSFLPGRAVPAPGPAGPPAPPKA